MIEVAFLNKSYAVRVVPLRASRITDEFAFDIYSPNAFGLTEGGRQAVTITAFLHTGPPPLLTIHGSIHPGRAIVTISSTTRNNSL